MFWKRFFLLLVSKPHIDDSRKWFCVRPRKLQNKNRTNEQHKKKSNGNNIIKIKWRANAFCGNPQPLTSSRHRTEIWIWGKGFMDYVLK